MKILQPKFLQNIDRHLLLNHRVVWATRIHYVLFYMLIGWMVNWSLVQLIPISTKNTLPDPEFFATMVGILAGMGLLFWLYKQSMYSIEGAFGHFKKETEYLRLGIYLLAIGSFVMLPVATYYWVLKRNASLGSDLQIVNDLESLEDGNFFFPEGSDKFRDNIYELLDCWGVAPDDLEGTDFQIPSECLKKYSYFFPYYYGRNSSEQEFAFNLLSLLSMSESKQEELAANYLTLMEKYGADADEFPTNPIQKFKARELSQLDMRQKEKVQRQLQEIVDYNDEFSRLEAPLVFGTFGILVFMLSVILQLYHGLGLKDFIISAIATILISIGTVITAVFIIGEGQPVFVVAFFVYLVGLVIGLGAQSATKYSKVQAIALAFSNFYTPLAPMLLGFIAFDIGNADTLLAFAIGGCILHAIFFAPPFWKLQSHVRSLPRD